MTLEELQSEWSKDAEIDQSRLGEEALRTFPLHQKYWKLFSSERTVFRKTEAELRKLKHRKYVFYSQGPTEETKALGWRLPPCGKILKNEARDYVDTDDDVVALTLRLGEQAEKVEFLESVIKTLKDRGFAVKNALDWQRFTQGG
jgi:hypothetical protein